jgi:trehalose 6-phosphate phosphatase
MQEAEEFAGTGDGRLQLDLSVETHAFFVDFDGTLVDIADHPGLIVVPQPLKSDLGGLSAASGGALAIVTGRPLALIDRHLDPLRLPGGGLHGLEFRLSGDDPPARSPDSGLLDEARDLLRGLVRSDPRLTIEDKGLAVAIHYRQAPDRAEDVPWSVRRIGAALSRRISCQEGKMVVELRVAGPDKGDVLRALMTSLPFRRRVPVMFGDDLTDEVAFAAAHALGGHAVHVGPSIRSGPPCIRVDGPATVRRIISALAGHGVATVGADADRATA